VLIAEFQATAGNDEALAQLVREFTTAVRAEPGNLVFAANRRVDDPSRFVVYEEYVNDAAFAAHLASGHGRTFNAALVGLTGGQPSVLTQLTSA
jgi:quinol monooxygenase YgiN